jgi:hypothetical protein
VLVNVEHLTAERYAERSHGCRRRRRVPASAATTLVLLPRLLAESGGLLREPGLIERGAPSATAPRGSRRSASRAAGRAARRLFSYRNDAIDALLDPRDGADAAARDAGHGDRAGRACLGPSLARGRCARSPCRGSADRLRPPALVVGLNLVRGEDSFVRAIWAGVPFVWQLYVQDDGAHRAKLDAFLDRYLRRRRRGLAAARARASCAGTARRRARSRRSPAIDRRAAWSAHARAWRDAAGRPIRSGDPAPRLRRGKR